jgi:hypothetical protein
MTFGPFGWLLAFIKAKQVEQPNQRDLMQISHKKTFYFYGESATFGKKNS